MSKDQEYVDAINSILSMEGTWSEDEINQSVDAYMLDNDVNINSDRGFSPLFYAVSANDLRVTQILLNKGADPDLRNIYSHSPLFIASEKGNSNMIMALLNYGANVDLQDQVGRTSIMIAASKGQVEATKLLIDHSENISIIDHGGNTALHYAYHSAKKEIIEYLTNKNADIVNIENKNGVSGNSIKAAIVEIYNKNRNKNRNHQSNKFHTKNENDLDAKKPESRKFRDKVIQSRLNSNKNRSR